MYLFLLLAIPMVNNINATRAAKYRKHIGLTTKSRFAFQKNSVRFHHELPYGKYIGLTTGNFLFCFATFDEQNIQCHINLFILRIPETAHLIPFNSKYNSISILVLIKTVPCMG